ncbi:amidohydrolase family protein [Pseudomonas baetica]|uniref:Amidohydrolase family protein n=1 Tax=Pseudomonas baetica TaxID=674054 RepID=A0ABX4PT94_9PSED|nr:amidohydrolase family protein [Pseudomonas baetica]PKA68155.1 amidohydrolase family protein [Pseudomonas baetica]PTC17972.1 hypothetical protein C0J26_18170 [Pseudomonas baetica]
MTKILITLSSLLALSLVGCGPDPIEKVDISTQKSRFVLTNVTVVDTRDGALSPGVNVLVDDGKVVSIAKSELTEKIADARVIDATGKYLVPGYMDMHTHVLEDERPTANLALLLVNGVTSFRQMSGSYELLEKRKAGSVGIPTGAPSLLSMPGPILTPLNASTVDQALVEVRKQKAAGADFIKIAFVSSEVLFAVLDEGKKLGIPVLGHVTEEANVLEAAGRGMHSIEHMGPIPGVLLTCAKDGEALRDPIGHRPPKFLSLLAHVPYADKLLMPILKKTIINPSTLLTPAAINQFDELVSTYDADLCRQSVQVFKDNGTWMVPTLIRTKSASLAFEPEFSSNDKLRYVKKSISDEWISVTDAYNSKLTDTERNVLRNTYALNLKMVKILSDADVRLLAGDDSDGAGWLVPGFSLHQEFTELAKAGLTPLKILQMTTLNGAEYVNLSDTLGTVEAGKTADLVLLDDNPIAAVENLDKISAVIKDGRYFSRAALDKLLAQVASENKE